MLLIYREQNWLIKNLKNDIYYEKKRFLLSVKKYFK